MSLYIKPNPAQERGNQVIGVNETRCAFGYSRVKGGLLYPNPAANLVSEEREEWLFE